MRFYSLAMLVMFAYIATILVFEFPFYVSQYRPSEAHIEIAKYDLESFLSFFIFLFGYLFINNDKIADAYNVWHNKQNHDYFKGVYKQLCAKLTKELGKTILKDEFSMSQMANPLDGFEILGYHNYFIL